MALAGTQVTVAWGEHPGPARIPTLTAASRTSAPRSRPHLTPRTRACNTGAP